MREAAACGLRCSGERGVDGRDAVWAHPDLLPTSDDLDDPTAYAARDNELDLSGLDELDPADNERREDRPTSPDRPRTPTAPDDGRTLGTTREGIARPATDPARRRARRGG